MSGKVVGFELNSQQPEKLKDFYSTVFGWQMESSYWDYTPVHTGNKDDRGIGGGIAKGPEEYPHGTRIQIQVDSIDFTLKEAKRRGARDMTEKMEFDDFWLAYFTDPEGLGIGLIEQKK
ncbi:VOC family protein [Jeotgalibacillus sp. ET6]|uniref:VOC family protein n=1 Tax=Jeotgalibacillus sp. ET6 TaxID=3037260 RepID=UPI0024185A5A|nr:VOC family protein [Jeotgalibacillus sp. ET6]MDG5471909.1 VOC family protein [Jeotgalibacillus sp. ET6]